MSYDKIKDEERMLQGNINRMCVTDSIEELESMKDWAIKRIETIYKINNLRLEYKKQ